MCSLRLIYYAPFHNLGGTGEDEEEDSNQTSQQKKPWGYTRHFCPVALKNDGVFWPGNNEISLRYANLTTNSLTPALRKYANMAYRIKRYLYSM